MCAIQKVEILHEDKKDSGEARETKKSTSSMFIQVECEDLHR